MLLLGMLLLLVVVMEVVVLVELVVELLLIVMRMGRRMRAVIGAHGIAGQDAGAGSARLLMALNGTRGMLLLMLLSDGR